MGRPKRIRLHGATQFRGELAGRLGWEIKQARLRLQLSVHEAARRGEVRFERYCEIEEGMGVTCTLSTIARLADVLDLDWKTVLVPVQERQS